MTSRANLFFPDKNLIMRWLIDAPDDAHSLCYVAEQATRWGADQELEACCALAENHSACGTKFQRSSMVRSIKNQRRPREISLKEKAFKTLESISMPEHKRLTLLKALALIDGE